MGSFISSRQQHVLRRFLDWLPAALSVLVIAMESTATMSADKTNPVLLSFWGKLFGPLSTAEWAQIHHYIRKTGHFVGYGGVSLAFFYSWRQTLYHMAVKHWTLWRRASALAVVCTLIIASHDQFHHSFILN